VTGSRASFGPECSTRLRRHLGCFPLLGPHVRHRSGSTRRAANSKSTSSRSPWTSAPSSTPTACGPRSRDRRCAACRSRPRHQHHLQQRAGIGLRRARRHRGGAGDRQRRLQRGRRAGALAADHGGRPIEERGRPCWGDGPRQPAVSRPRSKSFGPPINIPKGNLMAATKAFACVSLLALAITAQPAFAQTDSTPAPSPLKNAPAANTANIGSPASTPTQHRGHWKHARQSGATSPPQATDSR